MIDFCLQLTMATKKPSLGLILYLTGAEAERSCEPCTDRKHRSLCIVTDNSFPESIVSLFEDCCAMCHYRSKRWHWRHQCTLGDSRDASSNNSAAGDNARTASRRSSTFRGNGPQENRFEDGGSSDGDDSLPDAVGPGSEATSERSIVPVRHMVTLRSGRIGQIVAAPQRLSTSTPGTNTIHGPCAVSVGAARAARAASQSGNAVSVMSADALSMEDWEVAPGRISTTGPDGESKSCN